MILKGFQHKGVSVSKSELLLSLNSDYFTGIPTYGFRSISMCTVEREGKTATQISEYKYLNSLHPWVLVSPLSSKCISNLMLKNHAFAMRENRG